LVEFIGESREKALGFGVQFGGNPNGVVIGANKNGFELPDSVSVYAGAANSKTETDRQMQLLVQSGGHASLFSGTEEIDPVQLTAYMKQQKLQIFQDGRWITYQYDNDVDLEPRRIGATMQLEAFALDNGIVSIDIFPQFSMKGKEGREQFVRIEELITSVQVLSGQRIFLGGLNQDKKDKLGQIFSGFNWNRNQSDSFMNIYLTAFVK
jgi:hypothetical protein